MHKEENYIRFVLEFLWGPLGFSDFMFAVKVWVLNFWNANSRRLVTFFAGEVSSNWWILHWRSINTAFVWQVSLSVKSGVLSVEDVLDGQQVDGQGQSELSISSSSLTQLNDLLSRVTYTSTIYRVKTKDLGNVCCPLSSENGCEL